MKKGIYTKQNQVLCEWLRKSRLQKNLTIREVAERLDTDHSKVVRIERGERMLNLVQFVEWTVALQINPHDVIDKLWLVEMNEQTHSNPPSWERKKSSATSQSRQGRKSR